MAERRNVTRQATKKSYFKTVALFALVKLVTGHPGEIVYLYSHISRLCLPALLCIETATPKNFYSHREAKKTHCNIKGATTLPKQCAL